MSIGGKSGVPCGDADGVLRPCCGPPSPPPPPPPGSCPCGACVINRTPSGFTVTFADVNVRSDCIFYDFDGDNRTAHQVVVDVFSGTFALAQNAFAACSYAQTITRGDGQTWDAPIGSAPGPKSPLPTQVVLQLNPSTNTYQLNADVGPIRVFQSSNIVINDCLDEVTLSNDDLPQTACGTQCDGFDCPEQYFNGTGGTAALSPGAPCTSGNGPCDSSWYSSTVHLAATGSASCTTFVGDVDLVGTGVDLVGTDDAGTDWNLTCANGDDGNAVWTLFASDAAADNVVQWKKTGSSSPLGTYVLDELVNPSSCSPDFSPVIS